MAKQEGLNAEVAEIVNAVLGDLSLESAAIKLNYKVGREGLRLLRNGKIGRETTVRAFAEGFADRISELYGREIGDTYGERTPEAVSDWLAAKAGFKGAAALPAPEVAGIYGTLMGAQGHTVVIRPEFAAAMKRVTGSQPLDEVAAATDLPAALVMAMTGGLVPPADKMLKLAGRLDLSREQASDLYESGDLGPWSPLRVWMDDMGATSRPIPTGHEYFDIGGYVGDNPTARTGPELLAHISNLTPRETYKASQRLWRSAPLAWELTQYIADGDETRIRRHRELMEQVKQDTLAE